MEAEERGQGAAIADNLVAMGALRTPEITVIMGEGGSGGALGLAVSDRVLMLSDAVYSVVSPEGCSTILFKTAKRAADAAEALGITAPFLEDLGIIDGIVDAEGFGTEEFSERFRKCLADQVQELERMAEDELVDARYEKYRAIGRRDS
jgi:acetyl-CoA carboxylase carboxyl transferase subunit beta